MSVLCGCGCGQDRSEVISEVMKTMSLNYDQASAITAALGTDVLADLALHFCHNG